MNDTIENCSQENLELLLPWYINGTLDSDEHAAVREHLQGCPVCRDGVALLEQMQNAATSESPAPMVPRQNVESLFERLEGRADATYETPTWVTPRVLAAGVAIVVLGIALVLVERSSTEQEPQLFETATSTDTIAASGYVIAVRFEPQTSTARQQEIIAGFGGAYLGPGELPDSHRVAVSVPAATLEELAGFTREVEANSEVVSVRVVAVQLPVE